MKTVKVEFLVKNIEANLTIPQTFENKHEAKQYLRSHFLATDGYTVVKKIATVEELQEVGDGVWL